MYIYKAQYITEYLLTNVAHQGSISKIQNELFQDIQELFPGAELQTLVNDKKYFSIIFKHENDFTEVELEHTQIFITKL